MKRSHSAETNSGKKSTAISCEITKAREAAKVLLKRKLLPLVCSQMWKLWGKALKLVGNAEKINFLPKFVNFRA